MRTEAGEPAYTWRRLYVLVAAVVSWQPAAYQERQKPKRRQASPEEIQRMMGEFN